MNNKIKIVVLDGYTLNPGDLTWDGLKRIGELTVYDRTNVDDILNRVKDAEIVFVNKTPLAKSIINKMNTVKYIGVLATGFNVVDTEAAKEKGIIVTNIPSYGSAAVAQMTFALLLEMCHHVWAHNQKVKEGAWTACADFCFWNYPLIELAGKTIGLIGFGRIGQSVGRIAQALGMNVIAHDQNQFKELESSTLKYADLEEVLSESDVISLHCPLNDSTKGIINRNTIAKMKDGVMLINTARGPLIVEEDLAEALRSGKIAQAAVDVLSTEPAASDNPLLSVENCIITPHISWAPIESRQRLMNIAVDNLLQFLAGNAVNVVNK